MAESTVTLPPEIGSAICRNIEFYTLTDSNRIAVNVFCDDDQDAIQQAKQWLDSHDLEVWRGVRLVTRLKSQT